VDPFGLIGMSIAIAWVIGWARGGTLPGNTHYPTNIPGSGKETDGPLAEPTSSLPRPGERDSTCRAPRGVGGKPRSSPRGPSRILSKAEIAEAARAMQNALRPRK